MMVVCGKTLPPALQAAMLAIMTALHRRLLFVPYLLVLLLPAGASAQEQSVRPGINRNFEHPVWQQWVNAFERPGREVYDRRHAIVAACAVRPGMDVADIGAGTGLFTRLFAQAVAPGGTVYAVDISDTFVENILRTSNEQGLTNVKGIVNPPRDAGLPDDSVDLAFVTATYHHFEYPESMLAAIHRALRRGGRLIIIDYRRDPRINSRWVMGHVRGDQAQVVREVQAAGFRLVDDKPLLRTDYFLVFKKSGQ